MAKTSTAEPYDSLWSILKLIVLYAFSNSFKMKLCVREIEQKAARKKAEEDRLINRIVEAIK